MDYKYLYREDGYLNVTESCKHHNKDFFDYSRNLSTRNIIKELSKNGLENIIDINSNNADILKRSTFIHPALHEDFKFWLKKRKINESEGFIYIIEDKSWNNVKIGRTTSLDTLKTRYGIVFPYMIVHYCLTYEQKIAEKDVHNVLKKYNIYGEVYDKKYLDFYKKIIMEKCGCELIKMWWN